MIEINLLPEESKAKPKSAKAVFNIKADYFLYAPLLILGLLICVHLYLITVIFAKNSQLHLLNNKWKQLEPQRKILENFNKEYTILSQDAATLKQLTEERVNWSEKLNKLSLKLPAGIWFNEISVSSRDFTVLGSVVSLQNEEMSAIKQFIDNLKSDAGFFKYFNNLELSSVQRKVIGGYDILDFVLVGALKRSL